MARKKKAKAMVREPRKPGRENTPRAYVDAPVKVEVVAKKPVALDDLAVVAKFLETPINGHLPSLRYAPLLEIRPWAVYTTAGVQLCAKSLPVLVGEMRRLMGV
jgi:hypothetical protein